MSNSEHRKMRFEQAGQVMASSLSVREWCELNHVAESTMRYWLKIYREQAGRKQTARNDWIEVSRTQAREATALALRDEESTDATTVPNCDESVSGQAKGRTFGQRSHSSHSSIMSLLKQLPQHACEGLFGRLKVEMYFGEGWEKRTLAELREAVDAYLHCYNEDRIKVSLGGLSPLQYRRQLGLAA